MENREYVKLTTSTIILLGIFVITKVVFAYELPTHEFLTNETTKLYSQSFPSGQSIRGYESYLMDGIRREDDPPRWMNHFYDPIYQRGLTQDSKIDPFYKLGNWQESKIWAQDGLNQNKTKYSPIIATILSSIQYGRIEKFFPTSNFTWKEAIKYWIQGDKEMAMFTLGHIIHLIQDMSVPDHTRNDPHISKSPYENFTENNTTAVKIGSVVKLENIDEYFNNLANYSNNNFYSEDTIGIQSGYNSPQPTEFDFKNKPIFQMGDDRFGNTYKLSINSIPSGGLIIPLPNSVTIDNKLVMEDYWRLLAPKSIEYGAGIINLFFEEVEKNKDNPEFVEKEESFFGQIISATKNFILNIIGKSNLQKIDEISNQDEGYPPNPNLNPDEKLTPSQTPKTSQSPNPSQILQGTSAKVSRIIDGDTIVLENGSIVRFIGIDAPELSVDENRSSCLANESKKFLESILLNSSVSLEYGPQKTDDYQRTLAYVWLNKQLVNEIMLEKGLAYAYNFGHQHPKQDEFDSIHQKAKSAGIGLWGNLCDQVKPETLSKENQSKNSSACKFETYMSPLHSGIQINEIAWMGSLDSSNDEWIEIINTSPSQINIEGWKLQSPDGNIFIDFNSLKNKIINPGQYLLLERTDDNSVPSVNADIIYTGSLSNTKAGLKIFNNICDLVDEAPSSNQWPAGNNTSKKTAERDLNSYGWHTSCSTGGTPKSSNSSCSGSSESAGSSATQQDNNQTSEFYPIVINEIMYNPQGTDSNHEWIEIYNSGNKTADIQKWKIYENDTGHSLKLIKGTDKIIPNGYAIIAEDAEQFIIDYPNYRGNLLDSAFSFNNNGEKIILKNQDLTIDEVDYKLDWGGNGNGKTIQKSVVSWCEGTPTPGEASICSGGAYYSPIPDHLVISEMQPSGDLSNDEFIEIYNPTQNPILLDNYSIQYLSGRATSTQNAYKKNFPDGLIVKPLGFFLLANGQGKYASLADMTYSFSLSGISAGGIVILSKGTTVVADMASPFIVDYLAYGEPSIASVTKAAIPSAGNSLERKANRGSFCSTAILAGEFLGNGCDINDNSIDFEIRNSPRPQGAVNLPEPRTAPLSPNNPKISYDYNRLDTVLSWEKPLPNEAIEPFVYNIIDSETGLTIASTTSFSKDERIYEVGRNYSYMISASDVDGLSSSPSIASIFVPSFLKNISFFSDPNNSSEYIIEGSFDSYPFVPNTFIQSDDGGNLAIFYFNKNAPKGPELTDSVDSPANTNWTQELKDGILKTEYSRCSGNGGDSNQMTLADKPCPHIGTLSQALDNKLIEDNKFSVKALPETTPTSTDYVTVAFYSMAGSAIPSGGSDFFRLAAIDRTKYFFSSDFPTHQPPNKINNFLATTHNETSPYVTLNWDDTTDTDSVDSQLVYEFNYHLSNTIFDDLKWASISKNIPVNITESGEYIFYLRVKDEFGLTSESVTSTVNIAIPQLIAGVSPNDCIACREIEFRTDNATQIQTYKVGQTLSLNSPASILNIIIGLRTLGRTIPEAGVKLNFYKMLGQSPNDGLTEIFSTTTKGIPNISHPFMEKINFIPSSAINLESGNYFISLETTFNENLSDRGFEAVQTNQSWYENGAAWVSDNPNSFDPKWYLWGGNIYFKVFGLLQPQ
ncbi:MAG TPA: lamin tail domain-containing protein [Candidatus Paceibacterota bacterium]|nr:lamin tail domain-containing protein [Candidatus Paceibacterota bacterium]